MSCTFNVGDFIKCIDASGFGKTRLKLGQIYEVIYKDSNGFLQLKDEASSSCWDYMRFVLASAASSIPVTLPGPFKDGDYVEVLPGCGVFSAGTSALDEGNIYVVAGNPVPSSTGKWLVRLHGRTGSYCDSRFQLANFISVSAAGIHQVIAGGNVQQANPATPDPGYRVKGSVIAGNAQGCVNETPEQEQQRKLREYRKSLRDMLHGVTSMPEPEQEKKGHVTSSTGLNVQGNDVAWGLLNTGDDDVGNF